MFKPLLALLLSLISSAAHAHFYFVLPPDSGEPARLVYANEARVDRAAEPGGAESFTVTAPARLVPGGPGYLNIEGHSGVATLSVAPAPRVSQTNFAVPTLIVQEACWQPTPSVPQTARAGLALSCHSSGSGTIFAVTLAGKPVAARVTVTTPGLKRPVVVQTGADGLTRSFPEKGFLSARASLTEPTRGEHKGQKYGQVQHYATLTTTSE